MPPKLPADHPTGEPGVQPSPKERAKLVGAEKEKSTPATASDHAVPDEEEARSETILQDLAAAASPLFPEGGVAEAPTGLGRRNRVILQLCIIAVLVALGFLLWLAL